MKALLTIALGLVLAVAFGDAAEARVDDPDIDTIASYEYRVDPETGSVNVTIELAVTADKPNSAVTNGTFYEYYYEGYFLAVPGEAEGLTVTDDAGRELVYQTDETYEGVSYLEIDFRRNIFYRQTANVVVSFVLRGDARSESLARVNEAYAGFEIWLHPELEEATVTVVTPRGFEDLSNGSERFLTWFEDDEMQFIAEDIDPETYWSLVSLSRDTSLTTTEVEIDDLTVEVNAWPEDDLWSQYVIDNLELGLPTLIDQVGLPWPAGDELAVVESYSPYLSGYAGWYDPETNIIEIGDELDAHVVFHELSHVWFNDDLFDQRWITEGLADAFGASIVGSLGEDVPEPPLTSPDDESARPLNGWHNLTVDRDIEEWSYGASWSVTHALAEEVGFDTLSAAIQAAANDEIPYLGDGEAERGETDNDWRVYLDLLENRGGITDARVTDLFVEWVLSGPEAATLEARAESRNRYADLEQAGDDWAPPFALRTAMSDWNFIRSNELIADAEAILTDRGALFTVLEPLTNTLPIELEATYEDAAMDLGDTAVLMADVSEVADELRGAHDAIGEADGVLHRIGAIGTDYQSDLDRAVTSFENGALEQATVEAEEIDQGVDGLARRGIIFLVVLALLVLLVIAIGWMILRRRARRRPQRDPSRWEPPTGDPHELVTLAPASTPAPTPALTDEPHRPGEPPLATTREEGLGRR